MYYKSLENKRTEEEEEEEEGTPPKDDIRCLAVPFCLARVVGSNRKYKCVCGTHTYTGTTRYTLHNTTLSTVTDVQKVQTLQLHVQCTTTLYTGSRYRTRSTFKTKILSTAISFSSE